MKMEEHTKYFQMEAKSIMTTAEAKLKTLGEKIRREVILPTCKKHNYLFVPNFGDCGFGTFTDLEGFQIDIDEVEDDVVELVAFLNEEIYPQGALSTYVQPVEAKDLHEQAKQ